MTKKFKTYNYLHLLPVAMKMHTTTRKPADHIIRAGE